MSDVFIDRVHARDITVGVVGLGYVGLPLAISYAEAGFTVVGYDVARGRIEALNDGHSHIEDVGDDRVTAVVARDRFKATDDPRELARAGAIFICVPTPFDAAKSPDLTYVRAAAHAVASALRAGVLVVLQSTTYPGTTTEVVQPILERTGLIAGRDFNLAFSPERVDPGNETWTVSNTPKVVGGLTATCAARARALLECAMEEPGLVRVLSSPAAAEMTKLLENTYRAVNIALVNELAILSDEMGIDIWEVIDGASSKPFGFQAFRPGIGPGGHCIPVDPYYLSWRAREFDFQTKFIELAADTNLRMADYGKARIQRLLNRHGLALQGSRILCLGAAFKPGVSDIRNSRAVRVMELLEDEGACVEYSDPRVPSLWLHGREHKSVDLLPETVEGFDLIVALVAHPDLPLDVILEAGVPVFDAVGAIPGGIPRVERL